MAPKPFDGGQPTGLRHCMLLAQTYSEWLQKCDFLGCFHFPLLEDERGMMGWEWGVPSAPHGTDVPSASLLGKALPWFTVSF